MESSKGIVQVEHLLAFDSFVCTSPLLIVAELFP